MQVTTPAPEAEVLMIKIAAGPEGVLQGGQVYSIAADLARDLIACGSALAFADGEFVTVADITSGFRVSPQTVYEWTSRSSFPKPVSSWGPSRWRKADVQQWINRARAGAV